ncbi:MFS transporter [Streptomyces sp. NPDC048636]|uniref:MFS transporter n=1 Tax=Streptomyces sp. NPDC048636 TaxID=3155762 RepID=UPI0034491731
MSQPPPLPSPPPPPPPPQGKSHRGESLTALVGFLVFIELSSGILQGSTPVVLPLIGQHFDVSSGDLNWVMSITLLVAGITTPAAAKLGDIHGHRRVMRITTIAVAVGSVIVAVADSFALLLVGRALQGLFAAWLPLNIALVRDRGGPRRVGRAVGMLMGSMTIGLTTGMIGTGLLSEHFSNVRVMLWLPTAFILVCVPVVLFLVPESVQRSEDRIDWTGVTLLSLGLGSTLLALARGGTWGWGSGPFLGLLAFGLLVLLAFVRAELRVPRPLLDVRLIMQGPLAGLYVMGFLQGIIVLGPQSANMTYMATPSALGFGFGLDTMQLALAGLPWGLLAFLTAILSDRILVATGPRVVLGSGFAITAAGFLLLVMVHDSLWQVMLALAVQGIGCGLVLGSLPTVIVSQVPQNHTGIAMGLSNTFKTLGGSLTGAVFAVLMNMYLLDLPAPGPELASEYAYQLVWGICGGAGLLGALLALRLRHGKAHAPTSDPAATTAAL